jgi:carboxypeptidase C (cathepsin A)
MTLYKSERPLAKMFHVAYLAKKQGTKKRPVTFVFNGGPGAASAYLHMGALGPRRAVFSEDGRLTKPPTQVVANIDSWLRFTDLVFVDPIGTGFSRMVEEEKKGETEDKKATADDAPKTSSEFWEVTRDLESMGEFIQKFLSQYKRWTAPVFIAGESYGGFRVAKLARMVQEKYGVALNGAILISPAIEFDALMGSDYNFAHWLDLVPSMAASAWIHKQKDKTNSLAKLETVLKRAEAFALTDYWNLLGQGDRLPNAKRTEVIQALSGLIGIDAELLDRCGGRVEHVVFVRELLRAQRRVCGLYDASLTAIDPFTDRNHYEGPDPTLASIDRVFQAAINSHMGETLGVETQLDYSLLSYEVNRAWTVKGDTHAFRPQVGAMDDLRYGMVLNPDMKVRISHGYFDLITPYFSSKRLIDHMKLDGELRSNLSVEHFLGGHMFYSWETSRKAFAKSMVAFYRDAVS